MIAAVLFDIDDTLVDFRSAMFRGLRLRLAEVAGRLSATELAAAEQTWAELETIHFGRYLRGELTFPEQRRARVAALCDRYDLPLGPDPADQDAWVAAYLVHCEASFTLFPDVLPALDRLAAHGLRLGALSNSEHAYQERKLRGLGVWDRFTALVCCDDVGGAAKPDPRIFRAGCAAVGARPAEVVYVGDRSDTDAHAATAAGLRGVWLDRTGTAGGDSRAGEGIDHGPDRAGSGGGDAGRGPDGVGAAGGERVPDLFRFADLVLRSAPAATLAGTTTVGGRP